jgi:hypothetical protein
MIPLQGGLQNLALIIKPYNLLCILYLLELVEYILRNATLVLDLRKIIARASLIAKSTKLWKSKP